MLGQWVLISVASLAGAGFLRLGSEDTQGPVFTNEPPDRVDFSNMTGAKLDCSASGKPEPKISWTRADETLVTDVPRLREVASNGTLIFKPFRAEDYRQDVHTAIYKCVASNLVGSVVTRDVRVRAVVKQFYKVQVYDEFVIKGNIAVLKCHVPSFVKDYITVTSWLKDDVDIHAYPEAKRFTRLSSGELYIYDVSMEDGSKTYRCKTRHRLTGEIVLSSSGRLIVTDPKSSVPPRISHGVGNVVSRVGQTVELPCAAQAYPAPTYRWFRAVGKQLEPVQSNQDTVLLDGQLMLRHPEVQDSGKYACVITNTVGEEKVETMLTVTAPLSAHIEPREQIVDVGKSATFHCVISGHPVTSVMWFRNGRPLPTDGENAARLPSKEILLLQAVQREDRGMYQCFAENDDEAAQAAAELKLGDAAPVLHQTFAENSLNPGPSVSLRCVASGNPTPTVTWTLDGLPLPESKRFQISEHSVSAGDIISHVNISRLKVEDGGEYTCIASNRVGQTHFSARLNVYGLPYIRPMANATVVAGHDVTLPCRVAGHPIRSITWERDGSPFPANMRHKAYPNGTLVIHRAELVADRGAYTCLASSEYGQTARRSVWVNIMDPPKIEPFSFPRDLSEDMRARVLCTIIRGDLPITITWMKDNFHLQADLGILVHNADEFSSSLTFRSVTASHRGNYTCTASNAASTVNYTAELLVHVAPRWSVEPRDTQVMFGTVAILDCQSEGFPSPNVTWLFGGVKMPSDFTTIEESNFRFRLASNHSLLIDGVRKQDEGYYLCQATNGIGSGLSKPVFLTVNAPPQFSVKHKTQAARRGDDVSLHCDVRGDYPMEVTWRRNKQRIYPMDDHRFRIKEKAMDASILSELMIMHTERKDAVTYSCQAQNAFGQDEATIQLLVQEPPGAPSDMKIISQSSRIIKLGWAPGFDGHSAITTYHVQYKLAGESWSADAQIASFNTDSTASVTGLLPGMTYHFRVMAENSLGRSEPTEIVEATMPEEAPGGPPLAIEVKPTGSDSLRVTWRPPKKELSNGEILGYYVGYKIYETSEPYHYRTVEVRPNFKEELLLTELRKYTKYSVVVQAYNRMGSGPYSDEVVAFTLEDAPSEPPQNVQCSPVTSQSVQVGWEPPPKSAQNGVIRGYKLFYRPSDEHYEDAEFRSTSVSTLKTKLHGLEMFHNYTIQALAFTRAGEGVRSDAIYCRTMEDVPGSPTELKALAMSSDAILTTWRKPKNPNGHITKYVVYVRTLSKEEQPPTKHTVPFGSQSYLEIRNLIENSEYEFWVTAFTAVGEGESTKVVKQSPKSRVPARLAAFSETITVAWREDVRLSCRVVGIPTPKRVWKNGDRVVQVNERLEVYPDGTLLIRNVRNNDSGNFTCAVENIYGHDSVQYSLTVQAPPLAPTLHIVTATNSSIHLKWTHRKEEGTKVKGYTLSYKREYGEWEEVDISPEEESYILKDLHCGSRYQFYITAFNKVGSGEPSAIVSNTTKGSAPKVAKRSDVLIINSTSVTLLLDNWPDGKCAILYYVVQYSLKSPTQWMLVSNNVQPRQKEMSILDLVPGTWYTLRVMAHNDAGSTLTEFDFATLANDGSAVMAGLPTRARDVMRTFYTELDIVIPTVASIFILAVAMVMVWLLVRRKKKKRDYHHRENYSGQDAKQLNLENERKIFLPDKEILTQGNPVELNYDPTLTRRYYPENMRTPTRSTDNIQGYPDDICPYATFSLEDCRADGQESQEVPLRLFTRQDSCERYRQTNHYGGSVKSDTYARVKRHNQIPNEELTQNQENPDVQGNAPPRTNSSKRREKRSRKRSTRVKPSSTEYDSVQSDSEGSEPEMAYYPNVMSHNNRSRVPDLIYHTTDSSSSNPSSPDEKRPPRMPLHRSYGSPDAVLPLATPRDHWWNPIYKMNEFPVTTVPSPSNQDTTLLTTGHYHESYGMEYPPDSHLDLLYHQNESTPTVKRKMPHNVLDPRFTEGCTLKL